MTKTPSSISNMWIHFAPTPTANNTPIVFYGIKTDDNSGYHGIKFSGSTHSHQWSVRKIVSYKEYVFIGTDIITAGPPNDYPNPGIAKVNIGPTTNDMYTWGVALENLATGWNLPDT